MIRARFQFGMELATDKPRMQIFFQLNNFNQTVIRQNAGYNHSLFSKNFTVLVIELKAVSNLATIHEVQLVNYLTATGIDDGLLINFGSEKIEIRHKYRLYKKI